MEEENQREHIHIAPQNNEVIIRHGEASRLFQEQPVLLTGTIESVLDFAEKRKGFIAPNTTHVIINRKAGTVTFVTDENQEFGHEITGKMILHEYITELGINTGKNYSIGQLINLFKLNRRFFATRNDHASLVASLTNFQARTETEFENSNDFKGSVAQKKITKMKHDVPLQFQMKIPVFEGQEEQSFSVDIEIIPDNGSLIASFVSVELAELIDASKKEIFDRVKKELADYVQIVQ